MDSKISDQLKSLHTAAIDARNGYREAVDDARCGADLKGLFQEMAALHAKNANELHAVLTRMGERADDDGSFMSVVHSGIMDIRSLFGGLDKSVLPGLIDGEKRISAHYEKALAVLSSTVIYLRL